MEDNCSHRIKSLGDDRVLRQPAQFWCWTRFDPILCEKQIVALSESIAKSMASSDYVLCSTAILGVYQFPTHEY